MRLFHVISAKNGVRKCVQFLHCVLHILMNPKLQKLIKNLGRLGDFGVLQSAAK